MSQMTLSGRSLMFSRKCVGPRIEPGGTLALTGYYFWWVGGVDMEQKVLLKAS